MRLGPAPERPHASEGQECKDFKYIRGTTTKLSDLKINRVQSDKIPKNSDPWRPSALNYNPQQLIRDSNGEHILIKNRKSGLDNQSSWQIKLDQRTREPARTLLRMEDKTVATLFAKACLSCGSGDTLLRRWAEMEEHEWTGVV
jgi:hypothetical protein